MVYLDPPRPIVGGALTVGVPDISGSLPHRQTVHLDGAFVSENEASGTARYCVFTNVEVCTLDEVTWSASGPVDTPPGPDDIVFEGSVEGENGRVALTTDPSRTTVTSLTLEAVSMPPCTDPDNPLDVPAFFEPPLPIAPGDGSFQGGFTMTSLDQVSITGTLLDGAHAEGTLRFQRSLLFGGCEVELAWSAQVPPPPSPTPTPTQTQPATPLPGPTSTPQPAELPQAGADGGGQSGLASALFGLAGLVLLGAAAAALSRVVRARR
jgi:hypothetical protein